MQRHSAPDICGWLQRRSPAAVWLALITLCVCFWIIVGAAIAALL